MTLGAARTRPGAGKNALGRWLKACLALGMGLLLSACGALAPLVKTDLMPGCDPLSSHDQVLPEQPCFTAVLAARNTVELRWRVADPQAQVYILADTSPPLQDLGYQPAACASDMLGACSTRVNVAAGGNYRWLLQVTGADGTQIHVPASIGVPHLMPPARLDTANQAGGLVDILDPQPQVVSWTGEQTNASARKSINKAWIELLRPGQSSISHPGQKLPRFGAGTELTLQPQDLAGHKRILFQARECLASRIGTTPLCSARRTTGFTLDWDSFTHLNPLYASSEQDLKIHFSARSGDERRLSSTSLLPEGEIVTSGDSIQLPRRHLSPGSHRLSLSSCRRDTGNCSAERTLRILVDSPVQWTVDRDYTLDFYPGSARPTQAGGAPLDITYDGNGGTWMIGEFANSIEYLSATGEAQALTVPLARIDTSEGQDKEAGQKTVVSPFRSVMLGPKFPARISELGERATWDGSRVWLTQGGGMFLGEAPAAPNHSRIIAVDPAAANNPKTPWDDRLCVYNMPADDTDGYGNNQVIGLVPAFGRIWVAESRGYLNRQSSVISSFVPNPDYCDNWLNFNDPDALARQALQYCRDGETPENNACVEKVVLDPIPAGPRVAHLAADENSLWFTDALGQFLGHLDPQADHAVTLYRLPDNELTPSILSMFFRGFPWSIRVDDEAVYIGEYLATDLLRFDKATRTFNEIHVPVASNQMILHSVDIDPASDRLWFTLGMEQAVALPQSKATIGYIDLASWRRHVADPDNAPAVRGVIYSGLESIPPSVQQPNRMQNFRGIAVEPKTGRLAVATMFRNQTTLLQPRPEFRAPQSH